jgi:hypothetical protein
MRKSLVLAIAALLACVVTCDASAQIVSNVLDRVLMIQGPVFTGSAFTIDVDGRQYLITAKHMVAGLKEKDTIHVRKDDRWAPLEVTTFRCDDPIDIAVLVPPSQLTVDFPLEPSSKGLAVGEDAFFVGFPFGQATSVRLNGIYPMGLAKKAMVSGFDPLQSQKGMGIILDGYNNPGFSGSPVVFRDLSQPGFVYKVAAVLVAFRPEAGPVRPAQTVRPEQITAEDRAQSRIIEDRGQYLRLGEETGTFVSLNSGVAISYDIFSAVALIRQHPVGPKVMSDFEMK